MVKITKVKYKSDNIGLKEIDSVYLEGCNEEGYYKKEEVHDYLIKNPGTICVGVSPFPEVIPVEDNNEKYIKSSPNKYGHDNLLSLNKDNPVKFF